jgi:hypothetical protein
MVYISPSKEAVTIAGDPVHKGPSVYESKKDRVSKSKHPLFDIEIDEKYDDLNKIVEELQHNYTVEGTDERFKAVLEGYEESSTSESADKYLYEEFVRNDMKVYKITETTTVTIRINPENKNLYTHAQMKNGEFYIRAYTDNVNLDTLTGKRLEPLRGVIELDSIKVSVIGSMYDDSH